MSFKYDDYAKDLGELIGISSESKKMKIGRITFEMEASRFSTDLGIQAVLRSYMDVGNNISSDPTNYIYTHETAKYEAPKDYYLGDYAATGKQYLQMGVSGKFNFKRNVVAGATNIATTPTQSGTYVHGSEQTEFGENIVVSSNSAPIYNFALYIPIPKKNIPYTYTDVSGGTKTLYPDFDMQLRGALTSSAIPSGINIPHEVSYAGDSTVDVTYPTQDGLTGSHLSEVGYEAFDASKQDRYTMIRVIIPKINTAEFLLLQMPLEYAGNKTSVSVEKAETNIQWAYGTIPGGYGTQVRGASELTYEVGSYLLSGQVWKDKDNNGVLNPNGLDEMFAGVAVNATRTLDDGTIYALPTVYTDADGYYELSAPGAEYTITFPDLRGEAAVEDRYNFVNPLQGVSMNYSSKVSNVADTTYGSVKVNVNERNVGYVNAGYYNALPDDALIEDLVLWEDDIESIVVHNPTNLQYSMNNQTLIDSTGGTIATVNSSGRVTGVSTGEVYATYTYPNGLGGIITKTFKITVLPKHTVTYTVLKDSTGAVNGALIPDQSYTPPTDLTSLQEYVYKDKVDNKVKHVPEPVGALGTVDYIFDGWYWEQAGVLIPFDADANLITQSTVVYATFAADTNKDGIADKYQVEFVYITKDGNGNGNIDTTGVEVPFVEWVTRYVDPTLTGTDLDALSNLSETAAVSPVTVQANPQTKVEDHFLQWSDDVDGTVYASGQAIVDTTFTASKVTFTAQYAVNVYTVSYEPKDGNGVVSPFAHSEQVEHGNKVVDMATPVGNLGIGTDPDYIFDGWELADGSPFDANTYIVIADVTVYATFAADNNKDGIADKYQVEFVYITKDGSGNGNIDINGEEVPFVEWVTRYVDPTLTGAALNALSNLSETAAVSPVSVQANPQTKVEDHFLQWSDDVDGTVYASGQAIVDAAFTASKVTFTAQYTVNVYTVLYEAKDGNGVVSPVAHSEQVDHGNKVVDMAIPVGNIGVGTDPDYIFDGWELADGSSFDANTYIVIADVTVYATFAADTNKDGIADKYQVEFVYITKDGNGNGNIDTTGVEVPFVEWVTRYVDPTLTGTDLDALSNLSETAAVSPVTVQANPQTKVEDHFLQWSDDVDGTVYASGQAIVDTTFTASKVTFTAQYAVNVYTVSYEPKDGNGVVSPFAHSEQVEHGNKVVDMATPVGNLGIGTDPDYIFDGWELADGSPFDANTYIVIADVTVYATFAADNNKDGIADKYQVEFVYITKDGSGNGNVDINGEEVPFVEWVTRYVDPTLTGAALNAPSNLSKTAAVAPTISVATPRVRAYNNFVGWKDTATKLIYKDSGEILRDTFTASQVVFEAQYTEDARPVLPTTGTKNGLQEKVLLSIMLLQCSIALIVLRRKYT